MEGSKRLKLTTGYPLECDRLPHIPKIWSISLDPERDLNLFKKEIQLKDVVYMWQFINASLRETREI